MSYSWEATGEGDKYVVRLVVAPGEHIEYVLPHMPANQTTDDGTQFWWRHEGHIYSLIVPEGTIVEIVAPERFQDDAVLDVIRETEQG